MIKNIIPDFFFYSHGVLLFGQLQQKTVMGFWSKDKSTCSMYEPGNQTPPSAVMFIAFIFQVI